MVSEYVDITPIQIRYDDIDLLGHVNNARFLTYFEIGRLNYMKKFFMTEDPVTVNIVIARAEIDFERSVHFGDEVYVRTWISRIGNTSFDFSYSIEDKNGSVYGRGKTVNVFIKDGKPARVPNFLKDMLTEMET
ncbi:thioesterase family protein [Thermoplasma sp.]|uniref:acyl-CoA thioesterase n=1 Tax=Thermoplasma sp. TaxID=1973142 RepID=UPI00260734D4|nr:thioesterase family protein [Thermoplasma sp.]